MSGNPARAFGLAEALRLATPRLTSRVLDEMYQDPFWTERFGERGKLHANADGRYHLSYLIEALVADDASLFATYARWLRDVLVSRGMCSHHLADNFLRLAAAIDAEGWDGAEAAIDILEHGARALRHAAGAAAAVDHARERLAELAAARSGGSLHEVTVLLSYLADALAADAPERLAAYVTHLQYVGRAAGLPAAFDALTAAIHAELPAAAAASALGYLHAARAALSSPS